MCTIGLYASENCAMRYALIRNGRNRPFLPFKIDPMNGRNAPKERLESSHTMAVIGVGRAALGAEAYGIPRFAAHRQSMMPPLRWPS